MKNVFLILFCLVLSISGYVLIGFGLKMVYEPLVYIYAGVLALYVSHKTIETYVRGKEDWILVQEIVDFWQESKGIYVQNG